MTGFNVVDIVRVFSIYGLLLPIDRTGVGLDTASIKSECCKSFYYAYSQCRRFN
jgi:hypothetical protein